MNMPKSKIGTNHIKLTRQVFPRATIDDFKKIEVILNELKDLAEENKRVEKKYNLD